MATGLIHAKPVELRATKKARALTQSRLMVRSEHCCNSAISA